MTITYAWANAEHTTIAASDGRFIPADTRNTDYSALLASGAEIAPYVAPPPPVPQEVTNAQARAALMATPSQTEGRTLFDDVDEAVKAAGGQANMFWEYADTITRNGALVSQLSAQLGISDALLDQLFTQAASIEA